MSKCQLFKCQKSQLHVHVYTLQYYPLFNPIQHLTASFIRFFFTPFQPLTACTLSLYHTLPSDPYPFTTPHRLLLTTMQHLTAHYLSFQHLNVLRTTPYRLP